MIEYIVKSSILLLIFYLMFFILKKENNLVLHRYYLLLSLIFSIVFPMIHFDIFSTEQININPILLYQDNFIGVTTKNDIPQSVEIQKGIDYLNLLVLVYKIGVIILAFRFLWNLGGLIYKIRRYPHHRVGEYKLILLERKVDIHSFMDTIFVSAREYYNKKIDRYLLDHEVTHLKQRHSFDIIFIELIQVFYWFNPFIYLYRSLLRSNHEFLADEGVNLLSDEIKEYSERIINYAFRKSSINLASGFNYSLIKKRLVMLKQSKTKKVKYSKLFIVAFLTLATLLILPVFSVGESFITTPTKKEAIKKIKKINRKAKFHNGAIQQVENYSKGATCNFETYVLIAELISKFGHSSLPTMEIAKIVTPNGA